MDSKLQLPYVLILYFLFRIQNIFYLMKTPTRTRYDQRPTEQRKYNSMCVCQICTCGKHRCPCVDKGAHIPFRGETTYNSDYKPCTGIINQIKRPCTNHYHERHYDPTLLKTTYDTQYLPHKIENPPCDPSSKYAYRPKTGKFVGETEYNNNFKPKQIPDQRPNICVQPYQPRKTRFQGSTTYNAQFSPKKVENAFVPSNYKYEPRKTPFDGKTTYNTQFKPHKLQPTWKGGCCDKCVNGCKCAYVPPRTGRFEGESNYKANYKPYQIDRGHCPILDLPPYPRQCSPQNPHVHYSAEKHKWY